MNQIIRLKTTQLRAPDNKRMRWTHARTCEWAVLPQRFISDSRGSDFRLFRFNGENYLTAISNRENTVFRTLRCLKFIWGLFWSSGAVCLTLEPLEPWYLISSWNFQVEIFNHQNLPLPNGSSHRKAKMRPGSRMTSKNSSRISSSNTKKNGISRRLRTIEFLIPNIRRQYFLYRKDARTKRAF